MASLWSSLEKDVFNPQKKKLLETVRVWKTGKKKKMSILCVVVDTFRPMQLFLVKVKVDRGEQYKIAYRWPLAELKLVDGKTLNQANLRAIISPEKQVTQLMSSIDEALAEVARVEETLQIYDELLGSVKQQMDHIHRENSLLHRIVSNKTKLMDEILFLTTHLDLSKEHCDALSRADLSSPSRVRACIAAAEALSGCMNVQIQPGYRKLQSVAEQLIMFETLKQNFESSFIGHITSIFELQGNAQVPALGQPIDKLSAPSHGLHHEELVSYAPLMAWLRNANPVLFCDLPKVYAQNLSRLYDREIKAFFEQAKTFLLGRRKGKEPTTRLLSEIFSCLEPELRGFLDICNKVHPFGCLQVLATLNDFVFEMWGSSSALPSSFLNSVLGNMLLLAKSSFNKCIGTLCKEIKEAKMPSKMKGGILPSVSRFEEFVDFSEEVFRTAQRRGELDKAHLRLADSVFSSINSLSSANLKVNTDMVMMENFHHIHCFLCQKKIHCLEDKKREAKQRYSEHMEKYVIKYLGQPLEKLNVVWHAMEQEFIRQYQEFEDLIQRCYTGSGIAMDFSMEDLLSYFNSITLSNM
ncbi:exocyst complex component 1-like [Limosa lapponica baueri]|uniref:Exocyst complex component 1-like n=1 Tax=Limosa lapponica baueri TaxID=1758121 RepID=A0A2I0TP87_LIMLA|nr:exocyst complex component 1-like [Limosa lapponica baueri]